MTVASYAANTVKMHGKASTAVRTITTTLNNTSTVSVTGAVSGSSVNIAANTDVDVDIMLTEVPIPNFLGLAEITIPTSIFTPIPTAGFITLPQTMIDAILYPNHTRDANGVWTEDATGNVVAAPTPRPSITSFDAAFTAALESGQIAMDDIRMLMSQNIRRSCRRCPSTVVDFNSEVAADVNVTNVTNVSISTDARISAVTGSGAITIAADDRTLIRDTIQTEIDSIKPKLSTIVIFSAIDSDTLVNRTTGVTVGVPAPGSLATPRPNVLNATGQVNVSAVSSGDVRNEIISNQMGSATNEATEKTSVLLRGIKVANGTGTNAVGGLVVSALSDTFYSSTSLDSENELFGETSAKIDASEIYAGSGGVSVTATDKSSVIWHSRSLSCRRSTAMAANLTRR